MRACSRMAQRQRQLVLPERARQSLLGEEPADLVAAPAVIRLIHAAAVPGERESPDMLQREDVAFRFTGPPAPFIDVLLRPEERHGGSGVDQIAVPVADRHRKVDIAAVGPQFPRFDRKADQLTRQSVVGFDAGVRAEHGRNPE